jgi:tRNA threonylcarbamoyladenosine biosynthesis protein TsaB
MVEAQVTFENLGGYFYVEGPGSVLGLRLAAMAIRAWQTDDAALAVGQPRPVWACGSLHVAAAVALAANAPLPFAVFTEARQGHWHVLEVKDTDTSNINSLTPREVGEHSLPAGPLFYLPARKAWHTPPARAQTLPAGLRDHPEVLAQAKLLRAVAMPVPYTGAEPEYKKWTGAKNPIV